MKNKKLSIIEIISLLIILCVSIMIIKPIVIKVLDNNKEEEYINDVKTFVKEAKSLYQQENYRNNSDYFTKISDGYLISIDKLTNVNLTSDPYGYEYKKNESFITFKDKDEEIILNIKSCQQKDEIEKCYEIVNVNEKDLNTNSIKTSMN